MSNLGLDQLSKILVAVAEPVVPYIIAGLNKCCTRWIGLLCLSLSPHEFVLNPISLPLHMFLMFRQSSHTLVFSHAHPKPNEWCVNENDRICITSGPVSRGTVAALSSQHLEVQGEDGVGLVNVLWGDILKDFVEVVAGPCAGRSGWILAILDNEATILDESTVLWDTAEEMQVHLNCLRSTVPNVGHTTPSQPKHLIPASHHHPWLNTAIVVVKSGCPWQTNSGCIRDVVRTQTASRICVRLSTFDPIHPFRDIWLESSDVVEQSTGLSIRDYFSKKSQPAAAEPNPLPAAIKDSTPGNATPAWSSEETASPNWPPLAPLFSPSHATNPPAPSHPLLSCSLLNAPLKVKLTGGSFNGMDVVISLKNISGTLGLFYTLRNKNTPVQPSWVTLRHPNPWRDNGLLVVVEGEHCGCFVHRIRHVDWTGGGMIIIVAAMERVAGQPDKIDEELEFKPSELCVSEESAEDKKMNATLMVDIRKRAQREF
ncbi:hypothetical protein BJ165DRAFT_1528997 [Panaeolus papilionaceus]|nr:hypothetical protein BJ165DRAFT_1528997 [Panaeolus papilionaceus]